MKDEIIKKVAVDFFRYWWNTSGANTDEGFDKWWSFHQYEYKELPIEPLSAPVSDDVISAKLDSLNIQTSREREFI